MSVRYYGTGSRYMGIFVANRPRVRDPDLIYVGQRLWIPGTSVRLSAASRSSTRTSSRAETAIRYALAQVGDQYRFGAAGPDAFDCSGLVMVSFARAGIRLPHQSYAMLRYGVRVSRAELRRGDLVWPQAGHVAIYVGNGRIVHAANPRTDVQVRNLYGFYAARRVIR